MVGRSPDSGRRLSLGLVDIGYIKATGHSVKIYLPKTASKPEVEFEWKIPKWSNAIERDRARTYFQAYAAAAALHFAEKALEELHAGRTKMWTRLQGAGRSHRLRISRGRARRAFASRGDQRTGRLPTIIPIRRRRGTPILAIPTARPVHTKTPCRTRPSSKRTGATSSRASTSCARCAVSILAFPAVCTCTTGEEGFSIPAILRCLAWIDKMSANSELQQRLGSIEELLHKIESAADPSLRATVQELVELVMNLNSAGFERVLELIRASGGEGMVEKLGADDLIGSLLVLYGLHPLKLEDRVGQAVDRVRSRGRLHNGEIELLSVQDGAVRIRLHSNGQGCGSNLKETLEEAIYQAAPDLTALVVEGPEEKHSFVPIEMLMAVKGGL